jgi:hypothetical protein
MIANCMSLNSSAISNSVIPSHLVNRVQVSLAEKPTVEKIRTIGTLAAQHVAGEEVQDAEEKQSEQDGFPHAEKPTRFGFAGRAEIANVLFWSWSLPNVARQPRGTS